MSGSALKAAPKSIKQTGKPVAERVVQTFHRQSEALVSVTVKDAQTGQTETFQCSPDHPFYVPGEGWVAAGELAQGNSITSRVISVI